MKKQNNTEPFLPTDDIFGKGKINISSIDSIESDNKKRTIIKTKNDDFIGCPLSINKIYKKYKKFGLQKIKQNKIVNMNRLTEIKLLKDEKFNFALMTVIGGATHKVANMLQRKLRRIFKKYKLICWDNLLQLILWELLDNDDLDIEVI